MEKVPIFPLSALLFPTGRLTLQIFEQRYLTMVKQCLRDDTGFVIVLIREGGETGSAPDFYPVGTYGRIVDWDQLPNGLLGIHVLGESKVQVTASQAQDDGLLVGDVVVMPEEDNKPVTNNYMPLIALLEDLLRHPEVKDVGMNVDRDDARSVGWVLSQLLPLETGDRAALLAIPDPYLRLDRLMSIVGKMSGSLLA